MSDECIATQSECTICLLDYTKETKKTTECNHIFHQECLDKWLHNNTSCPLCRTELFNPILSDDSVYYDPLSVAHNQPSQFGYNFSRITPTIVEIVIGGYTQEDSELFEQQEQERGATLHRRENASELRATYQNYIDRFALPQPSGSTGITRVGSPFGLNVLYANEELIPQPLTQVAMDNLFAGSYMTGSRMQNMGEVLYTNSMFHRGVTFEEVD